MPIPCSKTWIGIRKSEIGAITLISPKNKVSKIIDFFIRTNSF